MAASTPLTIDEKNKVPKSRIPDASSARTLWDIAFQADQVSSRNRTAVQKQIDGHKPFNEAEQKRLGLGGSSNLNFGEAQADMDRAMAAFNDMMLSQERMAFVFMRPDYATASTREDLADKIAIAFHKAVTSWKEGRYHEQMIAWWFNKDGVGVYLMNGDRDPRWRAENLDGFKIPRNTKATEGKVEYAFCKHYMQAQELYGYIQDRKTAEDLGWNVDLAMDAIKNSYKQEGRDKFDWAEMAKHWKNNDLYMGAKSSEIRAWDVWVKEFTGFYSHHIFLEEGNEEGDEYLFSKIGRYENALQAFIISTYGIGTNGCYHGIRGLGFRIFPFVEHSNRLRNKILDGTAMSTSLMFEADDASAAQRAGIAYIGANAILPTGLKPVPVSMPNPALSALPVVKDLQEMRLGNTGGFMTAGGGNVERREIEVQQQMAQQAVLPASAINLFMIGRGKCFEEMFRRFCLTDWVEGEAGYEVVKVFQDTLKQSGVPLEALKYVESIVPARAAGAGSPAARQLAFQELEKFADQFDEVGKNNYLRDMVGSFVGFDQVDRYVPKMPNSERPVIDQSIAELQNGTLKQGIQCSVLENEDHAIHLKVHVKALAQAAQALQQGGDVMGTLKFFGVGIPHAEQHLSMLSQDPARNPMVKAMKDVLTGLNTMAQQLVQAVQQHQQAQAASGGAPSAGGAPGGQGGPQLSPEAQSKIAAAQAQIALSVQESHTKMQLRTSEALQRMQLRDAREAQNLRYQQQRQDLAEETAQ